MKPAKYLLALIVTVAIVFAVFSAQKPCGCESISKQIKSLELACTTLQGHMPSTNDNSALLDKIEQLTRLNERLIMENADLKHQMEEFGWLKEAADKEGLNP